MPFRTSGLRHEAFEHQRDRKRDDAEKYAADPPKIEKVAQHSCEHRRAGERGKQSNQRKAIGGAKIERENAVGIARQAEERGLAEAEGPAIAPEKTEPKGHERPREEIHGVADGVAVGKQRISYRNQQRHAGDAPE